MGDGIAHFGWRGQKGPKLKKKWSNNLVPMDLEARRQRTSRHNAKGPRGAAPLISYWWKYAFPHPNRDALGHSTKCFFNSRKCIFYTSNSSTAPPLEVLRRRAPRSFGAALRCPLCAVPRGPCGMPRGPLVLPF